MTAASHSNLLDRYRLAFAVANDGLKQLVRNLSVEPHWLGGSDAFWYRRETAGGHEFVRVDPEQGTIVPAFDHARVAALLATLTGEPVDPAALPFDRFVDDRWELDRPGNAAIRFEARGITWACDLAAGRCVPTTSTLDPIFPTAGPDAEFAGPLWGATVPSPDGRYSVTRRDHNLFLESVATGEVRALTTDGTRRYGYAEMSGTIWDGDVSMPRFGKEWPAQIRWSPDSRYVLTVRVDIRDLDDAFIMDVAPDGRYDVRPAFLPFPYTYSGERGIARSELIVFEAATGRRIEVRTEPLSGFSPIVYEDTVVWSADGSRIFITRTSRDGREVELNVIDAATGVARELVRETGRPYLIDPALDSHFLELARDGTVLWWSARDGWGHLHRYDLTTGVLLNQVTTGEWNVAGVLRADADGWIYFTGRGREPGRDPYYRGLYRTKADGSGLELLTPEDAEHDIVFSPSGRYFVDRYSTVEQPTVSVLRRADGTHVMTLETADISQLEALGWTPPERWREIGADGETEICGVLFRPWSFDPEQRYPVVEYVYGLPHHIVAPRSFAGALHRGQLGGGFPALGFALVMTDGRGTPGRSRAFRYGGEGVLDGSGQADHVAAITRLGERYPFLDLQRWGITGYSGGGFGSTRAILRYPDVYKVAVSGAGSHNHWQTGYSDGEVFLGQPVDNPEDWARQSNTSLAKNLRGKLLLIQGGMDEDVHPANTLQVAHALIEAGKQFDLLFVPRANHGRLWRDPYSMRAMWDYFVRHLLDAEPPDWNEFDYRDLLRAMDVGIQAP